MTDHGWVEIQISGTVYAFDPRLDGTNFVSKGYEPGRLYMKTYDQMPWSYTHP